MRHVAAKAVVRPPSSLRVQSMYVHVMHVRSVRMGMDPRRVAMRVGVHVIMEQLPLNLIVEMDLGQV